MSWGTTYYNTIRDQVEAVMRETAIADHSLVHALLERGNTVEEIKAMTPEKRMDEWLSWNGYGVYALTLVKRMSAAGYSIVEIFP